MAQNDALDQSQTEHLPAWLAAVPAILIGILAGLILHALISAIADPRTRIANPESPIAESPLAESQILNPQSWIANS